jgi:ubiquinone/menaquinone biosynthesis C-methylase UbiE
MRSNEAELAFLGGAEWTRNILSGYIRAYLYHALIKTGVIDALLASGTEGKTVEELAANGKLRPQLLKGVLDYLLVADVVLDHRDGRYSVNPLGQKVLTKNRAFLSLVLDNGIAAYGSILTELLPALKGEKTYGVDFVRAGDVVARTSYTAGKDSYPWILAELEKRQAKVVADLCCGTAELLIGFCRLAPGLKAVGIDIDRDAVREATERVKAAGLADRITIIQGDVTKPQSYADRLGGVDAFTCIGAIHEFLRNGEEAVERILRDMGSTFPGRYFVLGEFHALSESEYRELPLPTRVSSAWYQHVVHPLSLQGLPMPRQKWIDLFTRAGLKFEDMLPKFFLEPYLFRFPA